MLIYKIFKKKFLPYLVIGTVNYFFFFSQLGFRVSLRAEK